MRKLIAAMNMTLDGYCDHTTITADEEIHDHYSELLNSAGALIYGRVTYQLMEYWRPFVNNPTGNKSMDDFARIMDKTPKIVYSRTLQQVDWHSTTLKKELIKEDILALKESAGKDVFVGSPGMIVALTQMGLIDEYQIGVHPVIAGNGLTLFKNITERVDLTLLKTKTFGCGAVFLYYKTVR